MSTVDNLEKIFLGCIYPASRGEAYQYRFLPPRGLFVAPPGSHPDGAYPSRRIGAKTTTTQGSSFRYFARSPEQAATTLHKKAGFGQRPPRKDYKE